MVVERIIEEVMVDHQAGELTQVLINQVRQHPLLDPEEAKVVSRVLQDIVGDLPVYPAMWIAFWLGCAWQNLTH